MLKRFIKSKQQNETKGTNNSKSIQYTTKLPNNILLHINKFSHHTACLASVNRHFHCLFRPMKIAEEAAEYAIYPTEKNVEKLKVLLKASPELLLHRSTVENGHRKKIKGTIYQIALHEMDDELIDDVIKGAFKELKDGEKKMEAQGMVSGNMDRSGRKKPAGRV